MGSWPRTIHFSLTQFPALMVITGMCNCRKPVVPKPPLKPMICIQLPFLRSWGSFSYISYFCSTSLLAAGHWLNRANSLAIKYRNHPACTTAEPATYLLQCLHSRQLRMQPWFLATVESEDWTTEIKATYPRIQTTEPKLGTGRSDIFNTQHQQSSEIPPCS